MTSDALFGAGLSSSAAFETIIGTIVSGLYNDMQISMVEIAQIGQYSENVYFGKPSGLMDQTACAVGGLIHIDFKDPKAPVVEKVDVDFENHACSLCIVDTKGSHQDLTPDYAQIPADMKAIATYFGKEVLRDVDEIEFFADGHRCQTAIFKRNVRTADVWQDRPLRKSRKWQEKVPYL